MATNNAVNTGLSGTTGTGNFVGSNTPTLITPVIGVATGTSLAFSPTTGGIVGTTTNDNAGAGKVGEVISSVIANASAVTVASNTTVNVTSISLTAGDWDVWGNVAYTTTGTTATQIYAAIGTTSATLPDNSITNSLRLAGTITNGAGISAPYQRISLSGTTTYFLIAALANVSGSGSACGAIYARRAR